MISANVLMKLGKAGVAGSGPDEFNAPSAVLSLLTGMETDLKLVATQGAPLSARQWQELPCLCGLSGRESMALGCGMNARGSTEVIVASIGLSLGVINQELFTRSDSICWAE